MSTKKTQKDYAVEVHISEVGPIYHFYRTLGEARRVAKEESFSNRTVYIWKRTWRKVK